MIHNFEKILVELVTQDQRVMLEPQDITYVGLALGHLAISGIMRIEDCAKLGFYYGLHQETSQVILDLTGRYNVIGYYYNVWQYNVYDRRVPKGWVRFNLSWQVKGDDERSWSEIGF